MPNIDPLKQLAVARARLLNAALELFAMRGYAATPVDSIADAAGVSARAASELLDGVVRAAACSAMSSRASGHRSSNSPPPSSARSSGISKTCTGLMPR
ncbi:MAG: TetR/AcrR family transcriptional regulator [Cyanobacteria bacterium]|nr:TetR/AcrR family transcriptional regulator [Cyanobacteriota bacterium]